MTNRALRDLARTLRPAAGNDIGERDGVVTSLDVLTGIAQVVDAGGVVLSVTFQRNAVPAVGNGVTVGNRGPDFYIKTPSAGTLVGISSSFTPSPPPPPPPPPTGTLLYPGDTTFPDSDTYPLITPGGPGGGFVLGSAQLGTATL